MAVTIEELLGGDTGYIAKHNNNYSNIKAAIEALQNAIAATPTGGGDTTSDLPVVLNALSGTQDAIVGQGSYEPYQASSHYLGVSSGYAYIAASDKYVELVSDANLSFLGQSTGTYYIHVDATGTPTFDQVPTNALYSVDYDQGTGDFTSLNSESDTVMSAADYQSALSNIWSILYPGLDDRINGAERAATAILEKTATSSNITLTSTEAFEQSNISIVDGPQTANISLTIPNESRVYTFLNNSSSIYTVTVGTSVGAAVPLAGGTFAVLYCDGTDTATVFSLAGAVGGGTGTIATTLVELTDTPANYADANGKQVFVPLVGSSIGFETSRLKIAARVATTANITLSNLQTVDGVSLAESDRVLVKDQSTAADNGIYDVVDGDVWTRAVDADEWADFYGTMVAVSEGTANSKRVYISEAPSGGTLDTTSIVYRNMSETSWGDIAGTLTDQTDLNSALSGKSDSGHDHDADYADINHNHDATYIQDITGEDFTDLADTPADYSGAGSYTVKVNSGGTGLEFVNESAAVTTFIGLSDTPADWTASANKILTVNGTGDGIVFVTDDYITSTGVTFGNLDTNGDVGTGADQVAAGDHTHAGYLSDITGEDFIDLADTPADWTSSADKKLVVNGTGDGIVFVDDTVGSTDFTDLGDTPANYTGAEGEFARVNSAEDGLEFAAHSVGSGEWYLHQVYNVSGAVDGIFFDMPTGAKSVKFVGVGMKSADTTTNNQPFRIRFSVDNGTTYAGVSKYSWRAKTELFDLTTSTVSNGESTTYHKILEWYKQHTSKSFNFECVVDNPNGSDHKFINSRGFAYQDIDSVEQFTTGTFGAFEETSAITNVEFYMFSGSLIDMNAGSIYMYVRKDTVDTVTDSLYAVSSFFPSTSVASATMLVHAFTESVTFPSGLTNSQATAETAATAQTDYDVKKNGVSVGTVRFAAAGTTASFIMASETSFAAADKMQIIAPGTADTTLADISVTLKGTR